MNGDGVNQKPQLEMFFRLAGFFVPMGLMMYGFAAYFKIIPSSKTISFQLLLTLTIVWMTIALIQLIVRSTKANTMFFMISYHIFGAIFLLFIGDLVSPLAFYWVILVIASFAYFSHLGMILSIISFLVVVMIDSIFESIPAEGPGAILRHAIILFATIAITSIVIYYISKLQKIIAAELDHTKAEESLQKSRMMLIVNNLTDAVISTDVKGIIKVYNAASLNLLDTNVSLNGRQIDKVVPLTDQEGKTVNILSELHKAKTVIKRDDLIFSYDDDDKIRLELTYVPIRSSYSRSKKAETCDGYIIIMRDVTKEKSLEEERDEFISVISHELRTPIAIAEGTISNAQEMLGHPDVTNEMLADGMKLAHEQVMFLSGMVNDLSTLSRAERGVADEAEDIDTQELAHMLHDKYLPEARAKNLRLDLDLSPKLGIVHTSRLYLEELLQNFITNSIKYTKEGSVTISVKKVGEEIVFTVKDTGIGICKSDQAKVFEKFYRSEDYRTRESSGTGLGLYISAKLARKIGTKIELTSRLNFGSTFRIKLPIKKPEQKSELVQEKIEALTK